jgi:glycosyltransferase involved in cell wall biosynthesis
MTRALFVNGGILGLASFHNFLTQALPRQSAIQGTQVMLTDDLSVLDRVIRKALCQRLWIDGTLGLRNVDLARFRQEFHAGVLARRRIASLGAERFDVLHFHRQATAYASLDLMRRLPSVISIDCTQDAVLQEATSSAERASYGLNSRMDGAIFGRAAAVIATSEWAKTSLQRRYPRCAAPIHVMPDPVLLEHFDPGWLEERRRRSDAGARPRLLFVGGDFVRKGGPDLLAAWRAGALHESASLEIVTDWPIEESLPPGVTITRRVAPHSAAWRACWSRADAFVMPTRNEAFGLVYQEAAAAGLPAIGTRHNAVPEIVSDGETGLLVAVHDIGSLVVAMRTLVNDPARRHRMGVRARQIIEEVASPERYMARLTRILTAAAERKSS